VTLLRFLLAWFALTATLAKLGHHAARCGDANWPAALVVVAGVLLLVSILWLAGR
jgi:hypothetical protein